MHGSGWRLGALGYGLAVITAPFGCVASGLFRPDAAPRQPDAEIALAPGEAKEALPPDPATLPRSPAPPPALPLAEAEPVAVAPPPPIAPGPRSAALPSGFHNPMPGGVMAGYRADTGLDIAGKPMPIYAIAAGTIEYAEPGHTLWTGPADTANCVRFALDTPIPWKGRKITHVYYAHLSQLAFLQREGETPGRHIEAGELLGVSGIANHSPHLHLGLLLDGDVSQAWGTFLFADEVRKVLGGYKNGDRLPRDAPRAADPPTSGLHPEPRR
jgi:murein DD-endopeptidase MepM/ murein hydrolase activator NlpD